MKEDEDKISKLENKIKSLEERIEELEEENDKDSLKERRRMHRYYQEI